MAHSTTKAEGIGSSAGVGGYAANDRFREGPPEGTVIRPLEFSPVTSRSVPAPAPAPSFGRPETHGKPAATVPTLRFFSSNVHRITALALVEFSLAFLSLFAAQFLLAGEGIARLGPLWPEALVVASVIVVALLSMGLYQLRHRAGLNGVVARILVATTSAFAVIALIAPALPELAIAPRVLALAGGLCLASLMVSRFAFAKLVDQEFFKRRVLVWGAGERAATIGRRLRRRTDQRGFRVVAYVGMAGESVGVPEELLVGESDGLIDLIERERIQEIVMAMDDRRKGFPEAFLRECRLRGIRVVDVVGFLERESGRVAVELASPSWLIYSEGFRVDMVRVALKRAFDAVAAFALIAVSLPVMLLAAVAIWLEDRGPIFYRQQRTGQGGRTFRILKFRSMAVNAESCGAPVWAVRNDPRVTRVGAFIRRMRIDELPQAFNVLMGQMSFVGPRPERPEFVQSLERTIPFYAERHFVKPGITGWAQVRYPYGSSESDAREKLGYDLYYVANHSLVFDLMILLQTVEIVLFRIGSR